jgi:hypothetical protein
MILRSRITTAVAVAVVTTGSVWLTMSGASASAAQPLTSPSSHSEHATSAQAGPDVNNFLTYNNGSETGQATPYACIKGKQYYPSGDLIESAINNCEYHVYLQPVVGAALCINPGWSYEPIPSEYWHPEYIQIGPGTGPC